MKIEIMESSLYTWLRHVPSCIIAQLNQKSSPEGGMTDTSELFMHCVQSSDVRKASPSAEPMVPQEATEAKIDLGTENGIFALSVGRIAQTYLRQWLEAKCSEEMAQRFLDLDFSKRAFRICFPLLQKDVRTPDANGKDRYYANAIYIHGKTYYLCNDWHVRHKNKLITWLLENS